MTPATKQMTCDQLARKLFEIDDTNYRGVSPRPINPRDQPLLEYEMQVADARFRRCSSQSLNPPPVSGIARRR